MKVATDAKHFPGSRGVSAIAKMRWRSLSPLGMSVLWLAFVAGAAQADSVRIEGGRALLGHPRRPREVAVPAFAIDVRPVLAREFCLFLNEVGNPGGVFWAPLGPRVDTLREVEG